MTYIKFNHLVKSKSFEHGQIRTVLVIHINNNNIYLSNAWILFKCILRFKRFKFGYNNPK